MGLAGPIFPLIVRHEMPARPALGTGAYAIGLVLGGTLAAVAVVPLAGDGGDWRLALGVVTLAGLVSLGIWLALAPPDEIRDETLAAPRIPWRSPVAWLLGALFGLQSLLYYGVITWLAADLRRSRLVRAIVGEPGRPVRRRDPGRDDRHAARRRPDRQPAEPAGRVGAGSSSPA